MKKNQFLVLVTAIISLSSYNAHALSCVALENSAGTQIFKTGTQIIIEDNGQGRVLKTETKDCVYDYVGRDVMKNHNYRLSSKHTASCDNEVSEIQVSFDRDVIFIQQIGGNAYNAADCSN